MKTATKLPALLAGLLLAASSLSAQTAVYIPEGWMFGTYTGMADGSATNPAGSIVVSPGGTALDYSILDKSASPQGGEFIAGKYQGSGNWVNYSYTGIPLSMLTDSSGNAVTLVNGASYTANFWMRGNQVNDVLAGNRAMMFNNNVVVHIRDDISLNDISVSNATVNFNATGWTEVALPFTYDASTMAGQRIAFDITRASTDWDFTANQAVAAALSNNRQGSTGFDFVQPATVPEPSSALLVGSLGLTALLRRRRR